MSILMDHGIGAGGSNVSLTITFGEFTATEPNTTQFDIVEANFNPDKDILELSYQGVGLISPDNYSRANGSRTIMLTFPLAVEEVINYNFIKTSKPVSNGADGSTILEDSIGEAQMQDEMKKQAGGVASYDTVASHMAETAAQFSAIDIKLSDYSSYASVPDANGIYTVVDYKRSGGTLYMKSTLSGGTSPNYSADTWKFYDALGTTVIATKTWTLAYDANGKITSKVVA